MSKDRYINGDYLQQNPGWNAEDSPWKSDVILQLMHRNNITPAHVIEVGCGAGGILEQLATKQPGIQSLAGYDISPQAIALARQRVAGNIQFFEEDILENDYIHTNLLLVIDVVEHVEDCYGFLRKLQHKSDHFIFHIPLDASSRTLLKPHVMKQQRDAVGHLHYFSKEMVLWLLQDTGYEVMDTVYTKPVIDVQRAASVKAAIKKVLRNISFSLHQDLSARLWGGYSLMILAKQRV